MCHDQHLQSELPFRTRFLKNIDEGGSKLNDMFVIGSHILSKDLLSLLIRSAATSNRIPINCHMAAAADSELNGAATARRWSSRSVRLRHRNEGGAWAQAPRSQQEAQVVPPRVSGLGAGMGSAAATKPTATTSWLGWSECLPPI